jgi:hypothetical protein
VKFKVGDTVKVKSSATVGEEWYGKQGKVLDIDLELGNTDILKVLINGVTLTLTSNEVETVSRCRHDFVFLRTAKTKSLDVVGKVCNYIRRDTFYCRHCLKYAITRQEEDGPDDIEPDWFKN